MGMVLVCVNRPQESEFKLADPEIQCICVGRGGGEMVSGKKRKICTQAVDSFI